MTLLQNKKSQDEIRPYYGKEESSSCDDLDVGQLEEKNLDLEADRKSEKSENVFADNGQGPDFRGVSRWGAATLIAKGQIGLGVLGVPGTFEALGFVPGVICLCALCSMVTWMAYVVGQFRLNHPKVHSVGDAAYMMFGPIGEELVGGAMCLYYTLSYGSGLITLSVAVNSWSNHAACTMAWIGMWAGIVIVLAVTIRTMKVLQWGGYVALASIFVGIWIVGIACLAQDRPAMAPEGVTDSGIKVAGTGSSYAKIAVAVATQAFSLGGTGSFFAIHAEMKNQREYLPAVLMGQGFIVFNYIALSCVIYGKVGNYIASPALGSAGPLIMKIANGVALPALIFSTLFQVHIPIKHIFVRSLRGTKHLQSNSFVHWGTWIGLSCFLCAVGLVIAGAIPFFNDLLSLAGALCGTSFTFITPGFMTLYEMSNSHKPDGGNSRNPFVWLRDNAPYWKKSKRNMWTAIGAWFIICVGFYITVSGVYGTIVDIMDGYESGVFGSAFSCADNSKL
ncbi:hypothetical protein TRICI_005095 [Trichomonascus ciferrii]|uniref:Amino acid transporter transmembrane domain-containing protein n=1 Tax=Trichomonascus ciferrii TaxID=44093 RepID=A0A642UWM1_9ASCO|nr:hypothetical protein TRICI_005095 [Trichomonascus ciferrii]